MTSYATAALVLDLKREKTLIWNKEGSKIMKISYGILRFGGITVNVKLREAIYPHSPFVNNVMTGQMAYKPAETPLLALARSVAPQSWATVSGVEVLLAQGYEQFERWTGRKAPKGVVQRAVLEMYNASN
ncbi:hypothetical protein CONPUDRAFT_169186 [Coniophora puteana RWD-64-598 SS2]|uniref:SDH C-terminal domain-containing protein n=1 Tax=Coniophora puteana (strain RWD-64-598) TaxID=741705 RepID=A0A5M3M9J3_CONPW|nr:uncharacterized protein CONPUDRAFT_169186 [Coniophora puteana RWD-64-598 SS2]EIW75952.1 hypothetical protein CONPUDRAFT_169186 [Coniophora puteana RWD-64-598 SS2]